MPDLINPITGGVVGVSEELASAFIARGFRDADASPAEAPKGDSDKPAPKRGRPRKADADRD